MEVYFMKIMIDVYFNYNTSVVITNDELLPLFEDEMKFATILGADSKWES